MILAMNSINTSNDNISFHNMIMNYNKLTEVSVHKSYRVLLNYRNLWHLDSSDTESNATGED